MEGHKDKLSPIKFSASYNFIEKNLYTFEKCFSSSHLFLKID